MSRVSGTEGFCHIQCKALFLAALKGCLDNGLELGRKTVDFPGCQKNVLRDARVFLPGEEVFDGRSKGFGNLVSVIDAGVDVFRGPASKGVDAYPGFLGDGFLSGVCLPDEAVYVVPKC